LNKSGCSGDPGRHSSDPVTAALIKRGRGILKRKAGEKSLAEEWAEHKKQERKLEERHGR